MMTKRNFIAMAIVAGAALAASPAANASVAGGLAKTSLPASTATSTAPVAQGNIILAHGWRWRHHHQWYGGYGFGHCHWLKRKWRHTGKRYWKRRYFRCINGWY